MKQADCVEFLQWCLPRLHMRWQGFRKVLPPLATVLEPWRAGMPVHRQMG